MSLQLSTNMSVCRKCSIVTYCRQVPYEVVGRRPGDVATVYADATLAEKELGWKANKGLNEMCKCFVFVLQATLRSCSSFAP